MTWWRRDPTFSPVQRYAQRTLRSHDAALRTRCFSRTPSNPAQHDSNHGNRRPSGMSNLEWLQLQQYQRWRKKLMDDPYQAIFGASNDMLSGKGLKDWDWISKSFPKWMLREMESPGNTTASASQDGEHVSSDPKYPRRVEIKNDSSDTPKRRPFHFPQPSFRPSHLLRDDPTGVESPSDLRRPREQPHVKVVGCHPDVLTKPETSATDSTSLASVPPNYRFQQPSPPKSTESFGEYIAKTKSHAATKIERSDKNASTAEDSFIDRFLTETPRHDDPYIDGAMEDGTWRETTLQRRSSKDLIAKLEVDTAPLPKAEAEPSAPKSATEKTHGGPLVPPIEDHDTSLFTASGPSSTRRNVPQEQLSIEQEPAPPGTTSSARSTSKILSQLPEDDLDFLSADDIRAHMAAKRTKVLSDELRKADRAKLEKTFEDTHKEHNAIDSMLEAKVVNDQFVRRVERQMQQPKRSHESQETNAPRTTMPIENAPYAENQSQLESSVERMKSWLEESGAKFSSLFWQDPTEEADAKKTQLFFDNILARISKGRVTMKQVTEDLEVDIPASKPLLKRMKADEDLLDSAINALRQRSGTGKMHSLTPKKVRAIQELRLRYQSTDNDLAKAYAQLQELCESDTTKNMSAAFKRRLSIASKITQKNAHLTRYLIWSLQARLEDPEITQSMLPNYKAVANSLLTLRDTQMALARLVERAMLIYGVAPETGEDMKIFGEHQNVQNPYEHEQPSQGKVYASMTEVDKAQLRAKVAAEERLANEVDAQKSAMRGLSDDGYARVPKTAPKKSFEERGPLAHSLFRPFGPVLKSLESEMPSEAGVTKAEETATRELNDDKLVSVIQKPLDDTHGSVTVDHKQAKMVVEDNKVERDHDVKKFDMLKDDPTMDETSTQVNELNGSEAVARGEASAIATPTETVQDTLTAADTPSSPESAALDTKLGKVPDETIVEDSTPETSLHSSEANSRMLYTILVHDADTGKLSLTTSISVAPHHVSPVIPLHEALSQLDKPAKFVPHIKDGLEVVTAKKDMLILRDALKPTSSTRSFETVNPASAIENNIDSMVKRGNINPIDGTACLSPTGYVGPEESQEQLEKEFTERRQAAERVISAEESSNEQQPTEQDTKGKKKSRKGAGVVKTAIWAAAVCYVAGVLGEVAS
ncbi:hypothetical protein G6011_10562 [Alternaria panax]|uniref:Uncharacterized protein n=1 Tax=Alternaria panax TaxID=48097 RepID=A0AAD4NPY6_9PLEO|nr:hypothetical protein G6011_10562 [Alternaria panax]